MVRLKLFHYLEIEFRKATIPTYILKFFFGEFGCNVSKPFLLGQSIENFAGTCDDRVNPYFSELDHEGKGVFFLLSEPFECRFTYSLQIPIFHP